MKARDCLNYFVHDFSFKLHNSCTRQVLAIVVIHVIYSGIGKIYEVREVFLEIPKASAKVYHDDSIHRLKQNGVLDNLLSLLVNSFITTIQRVVSNG